MFCTTKSTRLILKVKTTSRTPGSFLIWFRGRFLALPHRQCAAVSGLAGKVCGTLGARFAETRLKRVSIQFVYPKLRFAFSESISHLVINGPGLFRRVDGNFRLQEDLPRHGR